MHKEIEIKIFEIDKKAIIQQLISLGAEKRHEHNMETRYYDIDPQKEYKDKTKFLRIRRMGKMYKLTFKALTIQNNMQVNDEVGVRIQELKGMQEILEQLGIGQYEHVGKKRVSYGIDDIKFDIDTYDDFPTYMEIEAPSQELVRVRVEKLGLQNNPQSGNGYPKIKTIGYDTFITQLKQAQGIT